MRSFSSIVLGVVLLGAAGWSQSSKSADDAEAALKTDLAKGTSSPQPDRHSNLPGSPTLRPLYSSSLWKYWVNLTIAAGGSLDLDSGMDFSYSDSVRVTVRCSNGNLADVLLAAYWTVPLAPLFNLADVVKGDTFHYRNVGGATFNTYGSQFRLRIINNGVTGVTLSQVLMFTRIPAAAYY
jgi:hypothetical protein